MQLTGRSFEALKYFVADKWKALIAIGILSFFVAFFESLATLAVYPVLAFVTPGAVDGSSINYMDNAISWVTGHILIEPLYLAVFLLFTLTLIKSVLAYANVLLSWLTSNKIIQETQAKIITSLLSADYQYLISTQKGDLAYRLLNAPGYIGKIINAIPMMVVEILKISMIITMLFIVSPAVTSFLLLLAAGYFLLTKMIAQNVSYGTGSGRARSASNQAIHAMNALKGIKSIKLYAVTTYWINLFVAECRNFYLYARKDAIISGLPKNLLEIVSISFICGLVLFFGRGQNGILNSIPMLGVFAFSLFKILPSLKLIGNSGMSLMSMLPHAEAAYLAIKETEKHKSVLDGKKQLKGFNSGLEIRDLSFYYVNSKVAALKDVSFTVLRGEFVGIIGHSGSGKTTLLDILGNLLHPSFGKVLIDGQPTSLYSASSFSAHIGYVGQDGFLFSDTIRNNVLFGRSGFDDNVIKEALRKADILGFVEGLPGGLDFVLADDGMKVSGGQRQRLCIARAMLKNPEILLLDEATSALDHKTEKNIMETILELVREEGKTVIFVTHRESAINNAHKIIEMRDGQIVGEISNTIIAKEEKMIL
ncbi:MAG: ABC transporter ATP-binding protein [Candidatus Saganbacteria bacterium]|nr:ABC transporter ATP-binding protein [Candidatus Saganbacteria bacterium]